MHELKGVFAPMQALGIPTAPTRFSFFARKSGAMMR
jgi:hypothetical protein